MARSDPGRIELVPIGALDTGATDRLVRALSRRVVLQCAVGPPLPAESVPRLEGRDQADADALLALIEARPVRPDTTLLGVTLLDLGHPLFTFFFGRARMGGAALVSLHRLDPVFYGLPADPALLMRRAVLECLHELGHTAGLHHCDDYRCVMHFTGDVEMLDLRGQGFCGACTETLSPDARHGASLVDADASDRSQ